MSKQNTIEEVMDSLTAWLSKASGLLSDGVTVNIAFAPGDATNYNLTFAPMVRWIQSTHARPNSGSVSRMMAMNHFGKAVIGPIGHNPGPSFIEESMGITNPHALMVTGLLWGALVGDADASAYVRWASTQDTAGGLDDGTHAAITYGRWDLAGIHG
jgi:hypothetical protein